MSNEGGIRAQGPREAVPKRTRLRARSKPAGKKRYGAISSLVVQILIERYNDSVPDSRRRPWAARHPRQE